MKGRRSIAALVLAVAATAGAAHASAPPRAVDVLRAEAAWVRAVETHDAKALGAILAEDFTHVTYTGALRYREDELRAVTAPKSYAQRTGAQTVDFAGSAAIVHGVNTISQGGRVVMLLRYTDVYQLIGGHWRAISAQETAVKEPAAR